MKGATGEQIGYAPASKWRRLGAVYLDAIGSGAFALLVVGAITWGWYSIQDAGPATHALAHRLGWFFINFFLFWALTAFIAGSVTLAISGGTPGQRLCRIETRVLNGTPLWLRPLRACARSALGVGEMAFFIALVFNVCHLSQFFLSRLLPVCQYLGNTGVLVLGVSMPVLLFGGRTLSERVTGVWSVRRSNQAGHDSSGTS